MGKGHRELVTQTFRGGRFDDHGLDIDVLPELIAYKTLLVETAKELWRRKNPGRRNLPGNFENSMVLKFYEIGPGSVAVPICREFEDGAQGSFPFVQDPDELDEAVGLVSEVIQAAGQHGPIPEGFPASLLERFETYGRSLRDDEVIEHRLPRNGYAIAYTPITRKRLTELAAQPYQDAVDVVGSVTMARVSRPRMAITLDSAVEVEAPFAPDQEDIITTALKEHATAKVRLRGRGQFVNGTLRRIVAVDSVTLLPGGEIPFDETALPIWEVFDQIMRGVSEEDLSGLPADAAAQHDHYIYGVPKRPQ